MRILQIDVNYDDSSTGRIVKDLQTGLEKHHHQVHCCYGRSTDEAQASAKKISSDLEVNVHVAMTRLTGLTGIFSPIATKCLIAEIEDFKPDVIHLHELHGYYVSIYQLIRHINSKRIPVLWTFHCEFMYTGKCGYAYECERWKDKCGKCPQLGEYPKSLFFDQTALMLSQKKALFKDFDLLKIITPSNWLTQRTRSSFLANKDIGTIYNGIDTDVFHLGDKKELRLKHNIKTAHVILAIAPDLLSERKGGSWVLELAKRMADEDVTFLMVGVNEPSSIDAPNVIALPRINDKQRIAEYYSLADLTLLTSKKETFSMICAESLACGTPIIGFDAGAPTEVAPPGFGCFVQYGDIDGLHASVKHALSNNSGYKSAEECVDFAEKNYSRARMIERYIAEYEFLLGRK